MKKVTVVLLILVSLFAVALADEYYAAYGYLIANKVNVRVNPESVYPTKGRLIEGAPLAIIGSNADCYYVSTALGTGYIPKMYVELLDSNMTYAEFREYSKAHPSQYTKGTGKKPKNRNKELYEQYHNQQISEQTLLDNWYRDPRTGETGLDRGSDGWLYIVNDGWWNKK